MCFISIESIIHWILCYYNHMVHSNFNSMFDDWKMKKNFKPRDPMVFYSGASNRDPSKKPHCCINNNDGVVVSTTINEWCFWFEWMCLSGPMDHWWWQNKKRITTIGLIEPETHSIHPKNGTILHDVFYRWWWWLIMINWFMLNT